jgi:hypothetical protein
MKQRDPIMWKKRLRLSNARAIASRKMCLKGLHPMIGRNLVIRKRKDGGVRRACRACIDARRGGPPMTSEVIVKIKEAITRGASIQEITKGFPAGGGQRDQSLYICSQDKLDRQRMIDPEFDAFVRKYTAASVRVGLALHLAKDLPTEFKPTVIAVARLKYKIKAIRTA